MNKNHNTMTKTTKLWISPALELRHSINGWPAPVSSLHDTLMYTCNGFSAYSYSKATELYEQCLAKAKEDSILVELNADVREKLGIHCSCDCHKPGVMIMHFMACCNPTVVMKPNTFIEWPGGVEVVYQRDFSSTYKAVRFEDVTKEAFDNYHGPYKQRKVARLVPVKSEKPINLPSEVLNDPFYQRGHEDATKVLKARILDGIREQWIADFGYMANTFTDERDGHFVVGLVSKVLDNLNVK